MRPQQGRLGLCLLRGSSILFREYEHAKYGSASRLRFVGSYGSMTGNATQPQVGRLMRRPAV
uniref:Uncharacterized protein n=1 Tax=Pristionchus pacificus TaxID=54126 RepID=A0A2A6CDW9_PRIPA|eukprot:PDM76201.1 hypothetical protein PRIPAC_39805 [Pristionchus pacificus]